MQNRIELHCHADGSLSEKAFNTLVKKNYHVLNESEKRLWDESKLYETVSVAQCNSLADYLKKFGLPCRLMQTPEDVEIVFENLVSELAKQGVVYAEIRFSPQLHSVNREWSERYLYEREVVKAALSGFNRGRRGKNKIEVNLILCCMRNLPEGASGHLANKRNLYLAQEFLGNGVCAIDLAGVEARDSTSEFEDIFIQAKKLEVPFTIHAGESGDIEWMKKSLESAINFGATRIGHGVGLMHFPELQNVVREKGITLECCLKSNLDTKAVNSLSEHPIKKFFDAGIRVTINTDNMTVSSTNLANEYKLAKSIGFTDKDIAQMQEYAFDAAFMTDWQRKHIRRLLKA